MIVRLKSAGENIASVIGHLERVAPEQLDVIQEYLQTVVPMVHDVERKQVGPMETLEFRQNMAGSKHPWRFLAQHRSDGTLRALGVLVALFQGNRDYAPTLVGIEEPETALHPAASAALREALTRASGNAQMIVTSHSPDLLDDRTIGVDAFLAVVSEGGETRIAPIDEASRKVMRQQLFFRGGAGASESAGTRSSRAGRAGAAPGRAFRPGSAMKVGAIVEGDGEVAAVPVLLRRLGA
jgi:predicted ATPase